MTVSQIIKFSAGAALLWYGVLRGAKGLIVKVQQYSFRSVNVASGTVGLNLQIYIKNPLFVGLTLKGISGDIYAQGVKVGYVNTTMDYYLSGGHTHIIPIVANLTFAGAAQAALANIQSGNVKTLTVDFDGKLHVGKYGVGVPLQFKLDYNDLTA